MDLWELVELVIDIFSPSVCPSVPPWPTRSGWWSHGWSASSRKPAGIWCLPWLGTSSCCWTLTMTASVPTPSSLWRASLSPCHPAWPTRRCPDARSTTSAWTASLVTIPISNTVSATYQLVPFVSHCTGSLPPPPPPHPLFSWFFISGVSLKQCLRALMLGSNLSVTTYSCELGQVTPLWTLSSFCKMEVIVVPLSQVCWEVPWRREHLIVNTS